MYVSETTFYYYRSTNLTSIFTRNLLFCTIDPPHPLITVSCASVTYVLIFNRRVTVTSDYLLLNWRFFLGKTANIQLGCPNATCEREHVWELELSWAEVKPLEVTEVCTSRLIQQVSTWVLRAPLVAVPPRYNTIPRTLPYTSRKPPEGTD